jgi:hypothetical protein
MTNAEIRAELIRSATEDENPYNYCRSEPFWRARTFCDEYVAQLDDDSVRTFYLLIAEALK